MKKHNNTHRATKRGVGQLERFAKDPTLLVAPATLSEDI